MSQNITHVLYKSCKKLSKKIHYANKTFVSHFLKFTQKIEYNLITKILITFCINVIDRQNIHQQGISYGIILLKNQLLLAVSEKNQVH